MDNPSTKNRHISISVQTQTKTHCPFLGSMSTILSRHTHSLSRYLKRGCDLENFKAALEWHSPYSAIIMAGGGNFNDFYWDDQPARIKMVKAFLNTPIRAFPQSIHMSQAKHINETVMGFGSHNNLQLAARDAKSYSWLEKKFGKSDVKTSLLPDIAFMWGNRPDIRERVPKT
jgi:exopolysaccharide biosynthesis predicted pyruvyltransferase EpsI